MTRCIRISGTSYRGACDPLASGVPREENWPVPDQQRVGRGFQFVYPYSKELAEQIASHLETLAEGFAYSDEPEVRSEARAFARDAARIRRALTD